MGPWTDLGDGVRVRQSAAFRMNSALLLDAEHAVIVDPGVLPSELDDLARAVAEAAPAAVTLVLTHAHWDHVLGRPWWPDAATLAHDRVAAELRRDGAHIESEARSLAEQHGERWPAPFRPFRPDTEVSGLRFTKLGPWRTVFRDAPGHCDSQLSLHLPERGLFIAADMLSDIEIPTLSGPCAPYVATLEELRPIFEGGAVETLVPGHGAIARGRQAALDRLLADLDYLHALDSGVRAARRQGLPLAAARERLAAMEYTGKRSSVYPTEELHLENIQLAYEGTTAAAG